MDVEPPTGDDLNRMLVSMKQDVLRRAAAEPPARRRPWARRHLGLTLSLVALLGIGGAGGALALVLPSPFQAAPAASPTPTSSPTPEPGASVSATPVFPTEPPAQPAEPRPAFDVDCDALGDRIGVASLVSDVGTVDLDAPVLRPLGAAYRQAGVLRCYFGPGGEFSTGTTLEITVSPAGDRGREWISGLRQSGLADLGVGDVSAVACDDSSACRASVVVGPWWFEGTSQPSGGVEAPPTPEVIRPVLDALAAELRSTPVPTVWDAPASSWDDTECSDLAIGGEVSRLLTGGVPVERSDLFEWVPETGIWSTQPSVEGCQWLTAPDAALESETGIQGVSVIWAPGAGWAVPDEGDGASPVDVAGADEAWASCIEGEGMSCSVHLRVDDTWVEVQGGFGVTRENQHLLIPMAEAVLAAQAAGSGQG
ncbi:hypothetical protein [Frigoribacterium faeni]|uniref:hypothetical protein n=1 Tax=Frigoribacterium faeni TaxID=145483 RepID=UPI00141B1726|nr:hypothetical protein [Frigoribacterium faeni]NIJ05442.1 hypothetical protein [Frigoribacterium faeni]